MNEWITENDWVNDMAEQPNEWQKLKKCKNVQTVTGKTKPDFYSGK